MADYKFDPNYKKELEEKFDRIYRNIFGEKVEIKRFQKDRTAQLSYKTDVIIKLPNGRQYSVDEKTRRARYFGWKDYVLELVHHQYLNNQLIKTIPGWLYQSTADIIAFATINESADDILEIMIFDLGTFKDESFRAEITPLPKAFANTPFDNGIFQTTINARASIDFIRGHAKKFWYIKEGEYGSA